MNRKTLKPTALVPGSRIAIVSPASAADSASLRAGCDELVRLGYTPLHHLTEQPSADYFSAPAENRAKEFMKAERDKETQAIFCARGGYGATYLMDYIENRLSSDPKILLGFSDITSLQMYFWRRFSWVTFYGPMVAAGFDRGAGNPGGYDLPSFTKAVTQTKGGWTLDLQGGALAAGEKEGVLLGGCLSLIETCLGTRWELDTRGAILLLEDRGMKPYQVDRTLMHLKQAGKFEGVCGFVLGEFPDCDPLDSGAPTVRDVCQRILTPFEMPIIWGAPVGHTSRPMLTVPLGIRACLCAEGGGRLEILEPAVVPATSP